MNGHVRNKQSGFVMLAVVLAITVLAAIAFALNNQGASQVNAAAGEVQRDQLRYVAEAGMAHAKLLLSQNTSCSGYADIPKTDFGADSYSATFSTNKDSPVTVTATGSLASGIEHSLINSTVRAYQPAVALALQLGKTAGKDTLIDRFYDIQNYGAVDDLIVSSNPSWMRRSLLEFDLSAIPAGVRIISAKLELQQRIVSTPGVIGVHRVTRSWQEGTGKGTGGADGATWLKYDGASAWAQPGGDFDSTLYGTATISTAKNGGWVAWDIRDLVDEWVSGASPNYGLILVGDGVVDNAEFESREELDPTAAPKLTIVYTCECGKTCGAAPAAGKNILLVIGDPASLTPEQADKKALMEGWGHTVTLIATSESQAAFDAAAALVDVVYVPELHDATPMNELDTKADDLSTAVITEEARRALLLGSWSLLPFVNADTINITDNTHYITETLPTGNVQLSTAVQSMWVLKGTLAPDLHVLGQLDGTQPGLAYLESGELRNDSTPAPARRVKLPWGSSNFDVNLFTDDALEIMKRAIEWGAGALVSQKLLFVVGNDANLTAAETAHQALVESWGYTVELIDDDASPGEFDTAAANNDLAFTTNDITASRLGTKLVDATIGVVTSEDNLSDEFGMASSIGWDSGTVVEINDNTHYITSPFATGLLTILSSSESLAYVNGTLSADLGQLASSTSGYGIVTLDAGAAMYGGGTAAGRRVQLPWGGSPSLEPNDLTPDGLTILQRALEWGAGAGPAPPAPGYFDQFNTSTCNAAIDYAGSDGAVDWSPWAWTEVNELDGSCAGQIRVASDPDIDDSGSFRLRVTSQGVRVYRTVDLTGFSQPTLSFDYRLTDYPALDFMRIRVFDGVVYNEIVRFTGPFDQTAYQSASFDLSAYAGLEIQVQFEFNGTSTTRTSYIDNVHVQEAGSGGGGGGAYIEKHQSWIATSADTWQTAELSSYGVPANAVVEVAVSNSNTGKEYWGGARAVGSSLDRRFQLHEAEGGGVDAVVMHVQANSSSQIQHYSDATANVTFTLLGYWTGAVYVEHFDAFKAGANASWQAHNLGAYGVGPNHVAEIAMSQTSTSAAWLAGTRRSGSSLARLISLHEAESGGVDAATMQVEANASSSIEVYAEANSVVDFHLLGYWSTPPGSYTEAGGVSGQVSALLTWEAHDLSTFGVPAGSVAQFIMTNDSSGADVKIGVRQAGSSLNRLFNLQEAEGGGADSIAMHVNVDSSSRVEWYAEYGGGLRFFYPIGWWVLN